MPAKKKNLQAPSTKTDEFVKPKPPADLWERMDAELAALPPIDIPDGAFTLEQFKGRYKLGRSAALLRLTKLEQLGKLEHFRTTQKRHFYRWK